MSSLYKNIDCITMIHKELNTNRDFLPQDGLQLENYLSKIDSQSTFERYYVNDVLAGFVSFYCNNKDKKQAFITLVLVDKNYRGMNIAYKMVSNVIDIVKRNGFAECSLEVKVENKNAIYLYNKLGFQENYINNDTISMSISV